MDLMSDLLHECFLHCNGMRLLKPSHVAERLLQHCVHIVSAHIVSYVVERICSIVFISCLLILSHVVE